MQADGRLVEHVQHAAQPAADLAGQTDALRFTAGQRGCRPPEGEVFEPHVDQKFQPVAHFAHQLTRDLALALVERPAVEPGQQVAQGQPAQFVERAVAQPHGRRVVAQPRASARRALHFAHQVLPLGAQRGRQPGRLFERRVQPLELKAKQRPLVLLLFSVSVHFDPLVRRAVKHGPPLLGAKLIERHVERYAALRRQRREHPAEQGRIAHGPQPDGPFG